MLLTSALIQHHFDYGNSVWYTGTTCRMKKKLQITQNKVIRFILGLPSRSHIGVTEFSSACMLPVPLRVDQLNHMYYIVNGISPHYLRGEVSMAGNHRHNTRSGNRACFVPRVNSFAIKSFFYTGVKLWNSLPYTIQIITNKQAIKCQVKKVLWLKLIHANKDIFIFY